MGIGYYHMGLYCEAKDTVALIRHCLIKRNLFAEGAKSLLLGGITDYNQLVVNLKKLALK